MKWKKYPKAKRADFFRRLEEVASKDPKRVNRVSIKDLRSGIADAFADVETNRFTVGGMFLSPTTESALDVPSLKDQLNRTKKTRKLKSMWGGRILYRSFCSTRRYLCGFEFRLEICPF